MGVANCQLQRAGAPSCSDELISRSYTLPPRWPFGAFHLVMEFTPGTCDLYSRRASYFCCTLGSVRSNIDPPGDPESHVLEAIASFLSHCQLRGVHRPCRSLDLGANNGWMSAYMMQLGSRVVSVEPAADLARALNETAVVNCWVDRLILYNARACVGSNPLCMAPMPCSQCSCCKQCWRWGNNNGRSQVADKYGDNCSAHFGLPPNVAGVDYDELLWTAASGSGEIDLLKMDADGPEGEWMERLEKLLSQGAALRVRTIIVEGSHLDPAVLQRMQNKHNYTVLRLDQHDERRFITRQGWDAYSPSGTFARLDRFRDKHAESERARCKYSPRARGLLPMGDNVSRLELEDEWFGVRAMRHVFRIKPGTTEQGWMTILQPVIRCSYPGQYVLTLDTEDELLPPMKKPSPGGFRSPERQHWKQRHGAPGSPTPLDAVGNGTF